MYRLKGDDGVELRMNDGVWESALELACLYGWQPAGTEPPRTAAWHARVARGPATWNGRDYFSSESQHVADRDSRALADAIWRALRQVGTIPRVDVAVASGSPLPSRASARADGLSLAKKKSMSRLAEFASRRGFTIDAGS